MKIVSLDNIPEERVSHDPQLIKRVMLRDGELPHLTKFAQVRFAPGQIAHAHAHTDQYEVFLIESGQGMVRVNGEEYQISVGTCMVFKPSEIHEITNTGSEELVLTYFGLEI
ncbi:MAG: cupin domain-containing protein [Chloroflexota bacterium]|nr:cupin domain-containing protein [Chloroflexota bacterium]